MNLDVWEPPGSGFQLRGLSPPVSFAEKGVYPQAAGIPSLIYLLQVAAWSSDPSAILGFFWEAMTLPPGDLACYRHHSVVLKLPEG